MNQALATRRISRELPYIKRESVRALDGKYASTQEALAGIGDSLRAFYQQHHPAVLEGDSRRLQEAIEVLRAIYQRTIFPEMKVDWSAYPDNIGHRDWPGCFRCHSPEMQSADGRAISTSCSTCHAITGQIEPEGARARADSEEERPFLHPFDDDYLQVPMPCSECHNGGFRAFELFGSG